MNLVVITYEFTYSPFSGNGILARSLVKSVLKSPSNHSVTVWCCRPADLDDHHHLEEPELTSDQVSRLGIFASQLTLEEGWRRLDRKAAYEAFHWDRMEHDKESLGRAISLADAFCVIDWTGSFAWRSIPNKEQIWKKEIKKRPPLIYLNFRVYSSGILDATEHAWYDNMELLALQEASSVITLSEKDKISIQQIVESTPCLIEKARSIHILYPPLRGDMEDLAHLSCNDLDPHLPPEVAEVLQLKSISEQQRIFVTCLVRLSPEKNTVRFVEIARHVKDIFQSTGWIPLVLGASSCSEYAEMVKKQLRDEFDDGNREKQNLVIVESFLSPKSLAAILSRSVLNIHPCTYEAYGMTIIEAAAFGVPTILADKSRIGAIAVIREDGCIPIDFPENHQNVVGNEIREPNLSEEAVQFIRSAMADVEKLESIGRIAKERAWSWDEVAYGNKLVDIVQQFL